MNTGTFKKVLAVGALMALAACEGGPGLLPKAGNKAALPLKQAEMARGDFILVPPQGYCVDRASLTRRFALVAGCRVLGAEDAIPAPYRAVMTVSLDRADAIPNATAIRDSAGLEDITRQQKSDTGTVTFRAKSAAVRDGFSNTHWRGAARKGDFIIGVALYAPPDAPVHRDEGRNLMLALIAQSRATTGASAAAKPVPTSNTPPEKRLPKLFRGLLK